MAENSNRSSMGQQGRGQNPGNQSGSGNSKRGLASADQETRERVASEGGKAAHAQGTAHEWNSEEAKEAGRKGGKSISSDKEHMSEIGRRGGQGSHGGGRQ